MGETINTDNIEKDNVENLDAEQDLNKKEVGTDGEGGKTDTSNTENIDNDDVEEEEGKTTDKKVEDPSKSKPTPNPADDEPKTRKRNIDFILERKNRKIEKLEKKANNTDDEEENDDNLDDDDAKIIDKRIKSALTPFINKQMQEEDEQEISTFIAENPDFAPYADKVRKFAQHPSRKELPLASIFYEVAGKDLLKIGADRAKKSIAESKQSQAGGGSARNTDTPKSVWDLSTDEFEKQQQEVRSRQRE